MEKLNKGPFVICDVGSNHRGSLDLALGHVTAAREAGCDGVKFQMYTEAELYGVRHLTDATDPRTCTLTTEELYARGSLRKSPYEMPREWILPLAVKAKEVGIEFLCTAFSADGVRFVDPHVAIHKIASCEMLHLGILDAVIATGKPFIVSTGGAQYSEVEFLQRYCWDRGAHERLRVLECVANYPAEISDYDLTLLSRRGEITRVGGNPDEKSGVLEEFLNFPLAHGVSDHTMNSVLAIAAVGAGATIFEKHFDSRIGIRLEDWTPFVSEGEQTPDSPVSFGPVHMAQYCTQIRLAFSALGDGIKRPRNQHDMAKRWRRRLKVIRDVRAGEKLVLEQNFGPYRSLTDDGRAGPAQDAPAYHGKTAKVDLRAGQGLWRDDVE